MPILEKHSTNNGDKHSFSASAANVGRKLGTTSNDFGTNVDEIKRSLVILPKRGTNGEIRTKGEDYNEQNLKQGGR